MSIPVNPQVEELHYRIEELEIENEELKDIIKYADFHVRNLRLQANTALKRELDFIIKTLNPKPKNSYGLTDSQD